MKKFLTTAAVFAAPSSPAFAQSYDLNTYENIAQNIEGAIDCGLISLDTGRRVGNYVDAIQFGGGFIPPVYTQAAEMGVSKANQESRFQDYCPNYPASILSGILQLAQ